MMTVSLFLNGVIINLFAEKALVSNVVGEAILFLFVKGNDKDTCWSVSIRCLWILEL